MAASKEAINFFSRYNRPKAIPNETGTEFDKTYNVEIDKNGHKELKETGKTNRYEKIQSFKEECEIANILVRATVDPTILNQRNGQYGDFTKAPKTLAEAQNIILKIKDEFFNLPVETRKEFNNSPEQYIAAYGSESWQKALGLVKEEAKEEVKEVKEESKNE